VYQAESKSGMPSAGLLQRDSSQDSRCCVPQPRFEVMCRWLSRPARVLQQLCSKAYCPCSLALLAPSPHTCEQPARRRLIPTGQLL
jgi:hypothetical protein